jgi:hypothetical protein
LTNQLVAGLALSNSVQIVDIENDCVIRTISGISPKQIGFKSATSDRNLVVLTTDGNLIFYDKNFMQIATVNTGGGSDAKMTILTDDNVVVYFKTTIVAYNGRTRSILSTYNAPSDVFILGRELANYYYFCVAGQNNVVNLFSVGENQVLTTEDLGNPCTAIQLYTDLMLLGKSNSIIIYLPIDLAVSGEITGFTGNPTFIGGLQNSQIAFYVSGTIHIATLATDSLVSNFASGIITDLQTNANGDFIVTSDANQRELKVWKPDGSTTKTFAASEQFKQFKLVNSFS